MSTTNEQHAQHLELIASANYAATSPAADALRAGAAALRGIKTKCERHKEKDDDE